MTLILKDKTILITGATSGIGKACALLCAEKGANLILVARRSKQLETLANHIINKLNSSIHLLKLDIRNRTEVDKKIQELPETWKKIDILVNNAGLALGKDRLDQASMQDCIDMIDTNFKGLLYVTKAILPGMINHNHGHIINIGSISSHETYSGGIIYCATKHAIAALSNGLKKDLLGTAIRVSLISPGMVKTEFSNVRFKGNIKKAEAIYEGMTPLSAEDVAETIVFCVTRPPHVNISEILILPTDQASTTMIHRRLQNEL